MRNKIHINDLTDFLNESQESLLVIGQPKGIGVTTQVLNFLTEKVFFEEDFSFIMLVEDLRAKVFAVHHIQTILKENYNLESDFNYSKNYFKVYNNVIAIISYPNDEKILLENVPEDFKFQVSYIDKDAKDSLLDYYLTDYLPLVSNKLIVATYDYDDSIYYMEELTDNQKVIVFSEDSLRKSIMFAENSYSYTIQAEQIIKGKFDGKNNL